jgi:hypothetical protein
MKRLISAFVCALCFLSCANAETVPSPVPGAFALAGGQAQVEGTLTATPSGKTTDKLDIVLSKKGSTAPLTRFDVELSKQMHVIAVSDDLKTFLHQHVTKVTTDGHFRLTMKFPRPALYHIYADSSPAGIGQQVLRFDLSVGGTFQHQPANLAPSALESSSGGYTVKFDSLSLKAGDETMLHLQILKDGAPATDVKPFLGVPAHAVFIAADTLDYIHAHPMPVSGMGGAMDMHMDMTAEPKAGEAVKPDLMLHVAAPQAGLYALWLQFNAGGKLQTVPFVAVAR